MSNAKRVLEFHISRLQDKNRDVRLRSISELRVLNDPDALLPLRKVFEQDTDPDVRKAAQEAGRAIFTNTRGGADKAGG